jgi:hypothetical protein
MPVFTAIAAIIVAEVGGIAFAAAVGAAGVAFTTAVVAAGLAIVTARLILGTQNPGGGGGGEGSVQSQGTRVQLPPASENKIPIIYGNAFQQGIITDAHISNENKTMTYTMVLSEKTDTTSTWTVNNIYWNDQTLNFRADGYTVDSSTLADGSTSTNYGGLIRCWVWAGGSNAANQIFGPTTKVNAYDVIPETTSSYQMTNMVFAVMQIDYDSAKGVTQLQNITFDITNSLSNPGEVWLDYMTSTRYGAGFAQSELDLDTCVGTTSTSMKSIANQIPPNQFQTDGTTPSTQPRYVCNGVLNTVDTVKTNLDRINIASASWTTYDHKQGKWRMIPNRAISAGEIAVTRHFNDDNITGEISVTSTSLDDIYNRLEISYANRGLRDQTDYYKANLDSSYMNNLEPVNLLRMSTAMCNNGIHAARVGLIELKQSRSDLLVSFQSDYSGLQTEAGDIIRFSNVIYGFDQKLFRVTRVREAEGADGSLVAELTALEYTATVYADDVLVDGQTKPLSDIPAAGTTTLLAPSAPSVVAVTTGTSPSFTLRTTINGNSGPVDNVQFWYSTTSTTNFNTLLTVYGPDGGSFVANQNVQGVVTGLANNTYYFKARVGNAALYSPLSTTSTGFAWNPAFDYGGI